MRIVVNSVSSSYGGALNILRSFYEFVAYDESAKEYEWIFLLNNTYLEEQNNINIKVLTNLNQNWINRLIFDLWRGRRTIAKLNPDLVFSFQNTITFGLKCPQVLYMHQSIPFQKIKNFSFFKKSEFSLAVYQHFIGFLIKKSIVRASHTIVQTQWVKDAVISQTKIDSTRVTAFIPPISQFNFEKLHNSFTSTNFFYPANNSLYKNHKCIYEANEILISKGTRNHQIKLTIESDSNYDNITFLGNISQEEVKSNYHQSTLIFPSFSESLGLPLLEAKHYNCLVLVSDLPFAREVLSDYDNAYFFNPFDAEQLSQLMIKVINKEIKKNPPVYKTKENSNNSWENTLSIFSKLLEVRS